MMAVLVLVTGIFAVVGLVGCVMGTAPAGDLHEFRGDGHVDRRRFVQPPEAVLDAYSQGADRTPGMRCVQRSGSEVLIDLRPTARILGGNFGMAIRVQTCAVPGGTDVTTEARNKVGWSWSHHSDAFRQAETALRMNAKRCGIQEVL